MVTRYELISPQVVKLFFSENATFFNDKSKAVMWTKRSKVLVYGLFHKNLPILAVFNLWIARSISNKLLWAPRKANVLFKCRHLSHESARCQNDNCQNCRRSFAFHNVLILYTFTGVTGPPSSWWLWLFQISTVANFEAEASLWSFEAFWPGDKHDEKISNCSSTPKLVQTLDSVVSLTILPHSHDRTPNLMVFSEISFWNEMSLYSIKTEMFTVAES